MRPLPGEPIRSVEFVKGVGPTLRARLVNHLDVALTSVDVTAITFIAQLGTVQASGEIEWENIEAYDTPTTVAVNGSMFDALAAWRDDSIGHNTAVTIPDDVWDSVESGNLGAIEITWTLTSGKFRWQRWEGRVFVPVS